MTGWNGTIPNTNDLWQVFGTGESDGPNHGYVPFAYDNDTTYTMRWIFTYSGGGPTYRDVTFHTLAGPDQDGDGVANNGTDQCPTVKGTLPNGCLPAVQDDPDKDGVYGGADKCPNTDGAGSLNGCPGGIIPDPPKPDVLTGILSGVKRGALLKKSALKKGLTVRYTCTVDSSAKGALSHHEEDRGEAQDQDQEEEPHHRQREGAVLEGVGWAPQAGSWPGPTPRRSPGLGRSCLPP